MTDRRMQFTAWEVLLLVLISFICAAAIAFAALWKIPARDLTEVLFGAASLALFVVSFFVGVLTIFGWKFLLEVINEKVENAVEKTRSKLALELHGRHNTILGFLHGRASHTMAQLAPTDSDQLALAIDHSRKASEALEEILSDYRWAAKNNFVFYLTIRARPTDAAVVLAGARELRLEAEKRDRKSWLLTYCRATLQYSRNREEREDALALLRGLLALELSQEQTEEARLYLASFTTDAT